MLVSVITVCRNAESVIGDCILSVAGQSGVEIEHILIDGASSDGTLDRIRSLERPGLRWVSEEDDGLYFALNKGLSLVRGEIVGVLHADDFFADSGVIRRVVEAFADPSLEACYGDLDYVARDDVSRVVRHWKSGAFRPGLFGRGWMPPHPTFYARRDVYERFGGFDTRFALGADWDLLLRFMEVKRIRTSYLPGVMVQMRLGGISNRRWQNILRNNWECLLAFRKYRLAVPMTYPVAKLCHRLAQFR
jgi:glycosyltransferase involved in cell wall biosynthesis